MARHVEPKYAIGAVLKLIRPWIALEVQSDRGFVKDFFDAILDDAVPRQPLPEKSSKGTPYKAVSSEVLMRGSLISTTVVAVRFQAIEQLFFTRTSAAQRFALCYLNVQAKKQ